MIRRGWGVGAAALAVAVMVSACNGDPEPVVTPSPTPSETVSESPPPSPTPTPSATALTEEEILAAIPEAARSEDFLGAVYFSQFFIELYPAMFTEQPETALFAALSSPECVFCTSSLESAQASAEAGAISQGGEFTWTDDPLGAPRGGLEQDGFWYIEQPFSVAETTNYKSDGSQGPSAPAASGLVTLKLAPVNGVWTVYGVNFDEDDA